jgi:hypothetical protein
MSEPLIQRYEHHGFTGWVVSATRRNKRFRRYFSDRPQGKRKALRDARAFRDKLVAPLPIPTKIKRSYISNTTGVIGVSRTREHTRSGGLLIRYVAQWPQLNGKTGRATFSVFTARKKPLVLLLLLVRRVYGGSKRERPQGCLSRLCYAEM